MFRLTEYDRDGVEESGIELKSHFIAL